MKLTIMYLVLLLLFPVLLQAQYMGGNGRGDVSVILTNISLPVHEGSISLPMNFELIQNYPNPFNPTTIISYELPITNYVKLAVYDVLGREVTVLVNEKQTAGTYKAEWDGTNYSSGVYFYKLTAGSFIETKKMVLIK